MTYSFHIFCKSLFIRILTADDMQYMLLKERCCRWINEFQKQQVAYCRSSLILHVSDREDGGSTFFWNIEKLLSDYATSYSRRKYSSFVYINVFSLHFGHFQESLCHYNAKCGHFLLCNQQTARSEMRPPLKDRGFDEFLPNQGYCTSHEGGGRQEGAKGNNVSEGNRRSSERTLLQCHFVHHEIQMKSLAN
jgi:hypothetical protein